MSKKNEVISESNLIKINEINALEKDYQEMIKSDLRYSLEVDPENKYNMSDRQKAFVKYYTQFKNIPIAAQFAEIDEDTAKAFYLSYSCQQEIRRINLAMYHRQFATRMLDINECGGYLTSILMDENVPVTEQLSTKDKLNVVKQLVEINRLKQEAMILPVKADVIDEEQLKNLSVETIKRLLESTRDPKQLEKIVDERLDIIDKIKDKNGQLTDEEVAYMKTLPTESLLKILNMTTDEIEKELKDENK